MLGSLCAHALVIAAALAGPTEEPEATQASPLDVPSLGARTASVERWVDVSSLAAPEAPSPRPEVASPERNEPEPAEPAALVPRALPHEPDAPSRKNPASPPRKPASTPPRPPAPPKQPEPARDTPSEGEDWLRIEDQLPPEDPDVPEPPATEQRDLIVERLLASERRKAQLGRARLGAAPATATVPAPSDVQEVPPEVRAAPPANLPQDLGDRFTRAVTEAEKNNPIWGKHALGWVGRVRVRLSLRDGVLGEPEFEGHADPLLVRLVEKTVFLLRRGTFSLPFSERQNGTQRFDIGVRLSVVDDVNRYAYERPTRRRPGRAYFVLPDGRLFEAFVDPNIEQ